jgi:hypothetical protein
MKVIAKFVCTGVTKHNCPGVTAKLTAEYDSALPEDRRFAQSTPTGTLEIFVTNPKVEEFFAPGEAYYLEFEKVPKAAAA